MSRPPRRSPPPQPTLPPAAPTQPALLGSLSGGLIAYCGLIAAAVAAIVTNDDFARSSVALRWTAVGAILLALAAGASSVLSSMQAVNLARRAEKEVDSGKDGRVAQARKQAARFGNVALVFIGFASLLALVAIGIFAFRTAPPEQPQNPSPITITINTGARVPPQMVDQCQLCPTCPRAHRRPPRRARSICPPASPPQALE
jgi:hypothetical protein